jgi:predicted metal-binding protein
MTLSNIIITVCTSCRAAGVEREDAPGRSLLTAVEAAAAGHPELMVRPTQCLSVCKRVCTVALSGEGKYTFLFGDLDPASDADAVVAMARACAAAEHGFVPWKERPEVLRKGTIARVPPPGWSPADGGAPG